MRRSLSAADYRGEPVPVYLRFSDQRRGGCTIIILYRCSSGTGNIVCVLTDGGKLGKINAFLWMYIAYNPHYVQRKTFLSFAVQKDRIAALLPGPRLCGIPGASPLRRKHATVFSLFSSDSRPIFEIAFLLKKFRKTVKISEISHLSR